MRVVLNNVEFYVFKDKFFKRPILYYNRPGTSLVDKYFAQTTYLVSKESMALIDILTSSSKIPELVSKPKEIKTTIEEQLEDLQIYLKEHFDINMDERNRFYTYINSYGKSKSKKAFFGKADRKKKMFFSFEEVIQIYNLPHHRFGASYTEDEKNPIMNKKKYIEKKMKILNSSYNINKKFVYLTIKRASKQYGSFILDSPTVVTIPK